MKYYAMGAGLASLKKMGSFGKNKGSGVSKSTTKHWKSTKETGSAHLFS
jgi:hypothetical protein